jgi:hypothetical protein
MDQLTKMIVEPVHGACEAHALHWGAGNFRTLRRYLWDFVLPVLTLAAMSALTVVVLVLLVSTVADMGLYSQSQQTSPDPWSAACFGPACLEDHVAYPERPVPMDMPDRDQASPGEPWSNSQADDQVDVPWARWTPE